MFLCIMLIERTDDGRGPFDEFTGNIIFYAKNVMILPADMESIKRLH